MAGSDTEEHEETVLKDESWWEPRWGIAIVILIYFVFLTLEIAWQIDLPSLYDTIGLGVGGIGVFVIMDQLWKPSVSRRIRVAALLILIVISFIPFAFAALLRVEMGASFEDAFSFELAGAVWFMILYAALSMKHPERD